MSKPIIAVDIDDVLAIENDAVRRFANEKYGHAHTPDDYLKPGAYWGYWESVQGVEGDEGVRRYGEYLSSGLKGRLEVMPGALDALMYLKQRYDLIIVTSREAHLAEITHEWLDKHFPKVFHDVAFVAVWTGDVKGSKASVCEQLGAQYLIDDNPGHLALAAKAGIQGILFGMYGWSDEVKLPQGTIRVYSWGEIREYFDGIE